MGYVGLAVDLYKETAAFTYKDRSVNYGRPADLEGFCAAAREDNPMERENSQYSDEELRVFFDAVPKADGKVHWQGIKHFIGAFRQMNALLRAPGKWRGLMDAFLQKAFAHPAVKSGYAGAIGYCLGGQSCLEQVRAGQQVQAICSLHGLLHSRPTTEAEPLNSLKRMSREDYARELAIPNTYNTDCRVLIQNGAADQEVPSDTVVDFMQERKASLLRQVEDRMAEFQAAQADSEQILRSLVERGTAAPEELYGVRQFVRSFTHRGNPAEADRKNFRQFASTFKLPGQHKLLEGFQDIAAEAGAWWAEKAYQEAIAGAGHIPIMQLMELAVSVGADPQEPMLLRARDVLLERLRVRISAFAQDCMEKDDLAEKRAKERNQVPPLGMAATNADRIEAEVFEAIRMGMDKEDPCIEEAQNIIKVLRQKDGERKRLHNRNKRLQEDANKVD